MAWTEELKAKAVKLYKEGNPTPDNTTELVKQIAEELDQSPNGVRMVLTQEGVYMKKAAATSTEKATTSGESGGTKRVSKDSAMADLRKAIEAKGGTVDEDIISKLTGKAAVYFTGILTA
ncbi:hypothetical protein UFOVP273_43 [uncultured Caudovirales phage]|uniref:D3 protein n=1 Tax=uncultured Caudovirales phage TaxID=2100421 RepID=A0A6J5LJH1_9CAUD|nr:hypothetical protein UFOVP273_43 [uncultured Caudovirales phage]